MSPRHVWSLTALGLLVLAGTGASVAASGHAAPALVKTTPARMLVDGRSMTLYVYAPDKKNKSLCYGECAEYWPPVTVAAGMKVPATMPGIKGTFGVSMRTNGKHQLTFDGAPLYRFVKDKKPGDMAGQGLDVAGGYWWVVVAHGAQSTSASSGSGSGSGW